MRVVLIAVPYDAGHRSVGVGLGPARLLEAGVANVLREAGHDVREVTVELPPDLPRHELARTIAAARVLAGEIATARAQDELPLVLAGNCSTAVGTLAAAPEATAVVWFDAHGDYNTAETTTTGMVDGLALSMVTGRALCNLAAGVKGFAAIDERRVVLVGARDLDPPEEQALASSQVTRLAADEASGRVAGVLRQMRPPARHVYVHLDLDVLDPAHARANQYGVPGGLTPASLVKTLAAIADVAAIYALAITAYDPECDTDGATQRTAFQAIHALVPRPDRE